MLRDSKLAANFILATGIYAGQKMQGNCHFSSLPLDLAPPSIFISISSGEKLTYDDLKVFSLYKNTVKTVLKGLYFKRT